MGGTSRRRNAAPGRYPSAARGGRTSYAIFQMARAQRACADRLLLGLGLQAGHDHLLMRLYEQDGQTRTELLENLGLDDPTIAEAITHLAKTGLVRLEEPSGSNPVWRVWLTEPGHALRQQIEAVRNRIENAALEALGDRSETFVGLAQSITNSIDLR